MVCARYWSRIPASLALFSILVLAGFLYSPWHLHSRVSPNACPFFALEHSAYAGERCQPVLLPPAAGSHPIGAVAEPSLPGAATARRRAVRAPPS